MEIFIIESLRDNYIYVLKSAHSNQVAVVDPSEAKPVLEFLNKKNLTLTTILNTHHHHDHVGGNLELLKHFPAARVFGGKHEGRIPSQHVFLSEADVVEFCGVKARVLDIPGHTRGHIAYHLHTENWLFSGDTVFGGTCGAIFEGTPTEMFYSLSKIAALPPNTKIWCSHEYTAMFMADAIRLDPNNAALRQRAKSVAERAAKGERTVPLVLSEELSTNPYLRSGVPEFASYYNSAPGLATFLKVIAM